MTIKLTYNGKEHQGVKLGCRLVGEDNKNRLYLNLIGEKEEVQVLFISKEEISVDTRNELCKEIVEKGASVESLAEKLNATYDINIFNGELAEHEIDESIIVELDNPMYTCTITDIDIQIICIDAVVHMYWDGRFKYMGFRYTGTQHVYGLVTLVNTKSKIKEKVVDKSLVLNKEIAGVLNEYYETKGKYFDQIASLPHYIK